MKVTKYEHACLVLEEQGKRLVIDPGDFTQTLPSDLNNVLAVVITHDHFDHLSKSQIDTLLKNNPDMQILTVDEVKQQLPQATACRAGEVKEIGPFKLEFVGGKHALIHSSVPQGQNLGVIVNDKLYYPGDSLDKPGKEVPVLALPVGGPWAKTGEYIDLLADIKPNRAFPTHDFVNSETGNNVQDHFIAEAAKENGVQYSRLGVGDSIDI